MPILVAPGAPAPTQATDATTYNGTLRAVVDPEHAGVMIICDFSSYLVAGFGYSFPSPFVATVHRITEDGQDVVVRSGDAVQSYGGIFHVYDDEPPMGQVVAYYAVPQTADGGTGPGSGSAAVLTWEPDGGFTSPGVWIKCLDNPDLSMPIRVQDWSTGVYTSGVASARVLGSPYAAVNLDTRQAYNSQATVLTSSEAEYEQLLEISGGVVFLVGLAKHRRRSGYYVLGDATPTRQASVTSPYDSWAIPVLQVDRPATAGQSLVVPGKTFADRQRTYPFFSDVHSADPFMTITATAAAAASIRSGNATAYVNDTYAAAAQVTLSPTAAATRTFHADIVFKNADGSTHAVVTGPAFSVTPGGTELVRQNFVYNAAGLLVCMQIMCDNPAAGESFTVSTARLVDAPAFQQGFNLLSDDTANFSTSYGTWVNASNTTRAYTARVGHTFRSRLEP